MFYFGYLMGVFIAGSVAGLNLSIIQNKPEHWNETRNVVVSILVGISFSILSVGKKWDSKKEEKNG